MGIRDLWPQVKEAKQECNIDNLKENFGINTVAVDANIVISQFYRGAWSTLSRDSKPSTDECFSITQARLSSFATNFRNLGIDLIWCFDGDKTTEKIATGQRILDHNERVGKLVALWTAAEAKAVLEEDREAMAPYADIMRSHATTAKAAIGDNTDVANDGVFRQLFNDFVSKLQWCPLFPPSMNDILLRDMNTRGHRCLRVPAISEAEKLASVVCHLGAAQAVYGDDSDYIALQTPMIIKDISKRVAEVYVFSDIVRVLGVPPDRLFTMCVILGNDFNTRVRLHGPVKAKKLAMDDKFSLDAFENQHGKEIVQLANCKRFLTISDSDLAIVRACM